MMYNPQLDTFLCVAEYGSFNKAAEKLYISRLRSSSRSTCLRRAWACSCSCARTAAWC